MRILVTGVAGPVGRALARQLLALGHAVSGIDVRPHPYLHPEVDFVRAGPRGRSLRGLADRADVVIHLAPLEHAAPDSTGIDGVVQVSHAASRAGARLVFVAPAAGDPALLGHARQLVSSGWAPSLTVRAAPLLGRQLDWAVCRTVATLLHTTSSEQRLRVLHFDDLVRFLVCAAESDRTGAVDVAAPDTLDIAMAHRMLRSAPRQPNALRIPGWAQPTVELDLAALHDDWHFDCGWPATDALADTTRALAGSRIGAVGATGVPGRVPLPVESAPSWAPADGASLHCAAPEGLAGEFDDGVDSRFPVFSARGLGRILPGPLTPITLDVQVSALRAATRTLGAALGLPGSTATEWESRGIAVFGHRPYLGVSSAALVASRIPGWDERRVTGHALGGQPLRLFPRGRPDEARNPVKVRARALRRHLGADTEAYTAAAMTAERDAAGLAALGDARLAVRIPMLRDRIHQGWSMTALWVLDDDAAGARLAHLGAGELELAAAGDDGSAFTGAAMGEGPYPATMRFTAVLRKTLREISSRLLGAELLEEADDVYFLTCDELLTLPADTRLRIKRRRAERERLQATRLPEVFTDSWTPVMDGASAR